MHNGVNCPCPKQSPGNASSNLTTEGGPPREAATGWMPTPPGARCQDGPPWV